MIRNFVLLLLFTLTYLNVIAQTDTLPKFKLINKEGVTTLSFINPHANAQQINIQRSADSLKNYITIYALPDPGAKKFSYRDEKPPSNKFFYRVFVLLSGANYYFTLPQRPFIDTAKPPVIEKPVMIKDKQKNEIKKDTAIKSLKKDTVIEIKKDTLIVEKPVVKKWMPSEFVFTANDGNIAIHLPDINKYKYAIKFFEEDDTFLFSIDEVQDAPLILDKTNFFHSGWFKFELYENGKLKEKNKFLITRDN